MNKSISYLMSREHCKLQKILEKSFKSKKREQQERIFEQFKINLEKHFFLEEKIILKNTKIEDLDNFEDIEELLDEHKEILELIEAIENNIHVSKDDQMLLTNDLKDHIAVENKVLYPLLDDLLSLSEKEEIIEESRLFLKV